MGDIYLSKGSKTGRWANAYAEWNEINWTGFNPSTDLVIVDGGANETDGMVYANTWVMPMDGTRVIMSREPGRNGKVKIHGARWRVHKTLLPWANQSTYTLHSSPAYGINMNGKSNCIIDAGKWGGIEVRGFNKHGHHVTGNGHRFHGLWIEDCGWPKKADGSQPVMDNRHDKGKWYTSDWGITIAGQRNKFICMVTKDCGCDHFKYGGNPNYTEFFRVATFNTRTINNATPLTYSNLWSKPGHCDGIQFQNGGVIKGIRIRECLWFAFMQQHIFGDKTSMEDTLIEDSLYFGIGTSGILFKPGLNHGPNNRINRCTFDGVINSEWQTFRHAGNGYSMNDCLHTGKKIIRGNSGSGSGNYYWQVDPSEVVDNGVSFTNTGENPYARSASQGSWDIYTADFTLKSGKPYSSKGSKITGLAHLLSLPFVSSGLTDWEDDGGGGGGGGPPPPPHHHHRTRSRSGTPQTARAYNRCSWMGCVSAGRSRRHTAARLARSTCGWRTQPRTGRSFAALCMPTMDRTSPAHWWLCPARSVSQGIPPSASSCCRSLAAA